MDVAGQMQSLRDGTACQLVDVRADGSRHRTAGTEEAMKQTIEVEIRQLSTSWLAVAVRKGDLPLLQVQAPSEREVMQEIYLRLRELRDGINAALEAAP